MQRIKELFIAVGILALLSFSANAATLAGIGTYSPGFDSSPDPDGQTLVAVTRGGVTYTRIQGATFLANSGTAGTLFGAENDGTPVSTAIALTGLTTSNGRTNMAQTDFSLGTTVNAGSSAVFFFGEINTAGQDGDAVRVQPLAGGVPIGTWVLDIVAADYGPQSGLMDVTNGVPDIATRITTFQLQDFTGGVGTLTGVDGLRLLDNVGADDFDPNVVGVLLIPEPSSLALWSLFAVAMVGFGLRKWRHK